MEKHYEELIDRVRFRLDDLDTQNQEFDNEYIKGHIRNNMESYGYDFPLEDSRDKQLIVVETLIDIVTALKVWADGESYSYKNDAIQITRGLMSKHFQDTINLLKEERNKIIGLGRGDRKHTR